MTKEQKVKLEQVVREWTHERGWLLSDELFAMVVELLAAQRAAVLEEVAITIVDSHCIGFAKDDEPYELIINELRQAAQVLTP